MNIGLIFGGMSNERDISVKSFEAVYKNIDKNKYKVKLIFIDEKGNFYIVEDIKLSGKKLISNVFEYLQSFEVVFPILHGKYGEDGIIQGMLEMLNIKYVGCNLLSSSICMDKITSKYIFEKAGFNQALYEWIKYKDGKIIYVDKNLDEQEIDFDNLELILCSNLAYPIYVKPSRSGSSIGISKVNNKNELKNAILLASQTDEKIVFEEEILGRELECALLEDNEKIISSVGEVLVNNEFYDFEKKYSSEFINTTINPDITENNINKIEKLARKAFNAVGACGLSRVDFFLKNEKIYINEINTMPGFTSSSMYPKLLENANINFSKIIDILITNAINKK